MSVFSPLECEQYSRHLKLAGFGPEAQQRLKNARVLLVGAGGLGCPAGLYLAASGVGTIGVVDFDCVERSNLQRQIAHTVDTIGALKVDSLVSAMRAINPLVAYRTYPLRIDAENVEALFSDYDLILDGSDNYATRFLLADAAYLQRRVLLQGAVYEYGAQMTLFVPEETPCYRCLFETPPTRNALAACADLGVLAVLPGTVGLMMATEALKHLAGLPGSIAGSLLQYDALRQTLRRMPIERNADCPLCGKNPTITTVREIDLPVCSKESDFPPEYSLFVGEFSEKIEPLLFGEGVSDDLHLLDVRELFEFQDGHLPRATNLPLGQLRAHIRDRIKKTETPIFVYCQKGVRSLEAVQILRNLGYENAFSLAGGLNAWLQNRTISGLERH